MLGLEGNSIFMAYILSIISALGCLVYGIINWNKGADTEKEDIQEEKKWESDEEKISETL
jgi:hypothetical protein